MAIDKQAAAAAIDAFLRAIGRDVATEPELAGTGARVADAYVDELCQGYAVDTRALLEESALSASGAPEIVAVRDVPLVTMCPHHLLPAPGTATIAMRPGARLVGVGALAALAAAHARRLTLQEHLGDRIVDDIAAVLAPRSVICRVVLSHYCMIARGERAFGARVETLAYRGPEGGLAEVLALLGAGAGGGAA